MKKSLFERISEKIDAPPVAPLLAAMLGFSFDHDACWVWRGAYSQKVRGSWTAPPRPVLKLAGKTTYVLRVMLSILDGTPLDERSHLQACHRCDNPDCVNPHHAYWGTHLDNHQDRRTRWPESFLRRDRRSQRRTPAATEPAA